MWLKVCGLLLLATASTWYGFCRAAQYAARTQQLRQAVSFLQALEMHITYAGTVLPQALTQAASTVSEPVAGVFRAVAAQVGGGRLPPDRALTLVLREKAGELAMAAPELEVLAHMSRCLGRSDRQDQVKHLRLAQGQLQALAQDAAAEQERSGRMWRYLGVCGGLALAVLLL